MDKEKEELRSFLSYFHLSANIAQKNREDKNFISESFFALSGFFCSFHHQLSVSYFLDGVSKRNDADDDGQWTRMMKEIILSMLSFFLGLFFCVRKTNKLIWL